MILNSDFIHAIKNDERNILNIAFYGLINVFMLGRKYCFYLSSDLLSVSVTEGGIEIGEFSSEFMYKNPIFCGLLGVENHEFVFDEKTNSEVGNYLIKIKNSATDTFDLSNSVLEYESFLKFMRSNLFKINRFLSNEPLDQEKLKYAVASRYKNLKLN